ncbi:PA-phosphatase [Flavobacterium sp. L1I52]|uniref:PA-phosphatase n=1 Tax=Flavobacterium pokkalii TaxID=1940408 RepID=A0ABR7UPM1_9FLAO|nr:phosphatase PAP2 family protein [Flavobacterium pokkalii]MBD0724847.1 PA-phosphatase [Flavobacterium pokkalii]
MKTKRAVFFLLMILGFAMQAQQSVEKEVDSLAIKNSSQLKFNKKQLIIPAVFITYGIVGLESDFLKGINAEVKEEVNENIDHKLTIDDFSQYAPAVSVYALGALGIKGKNNLRDKTIILTTSYLIMGLTVESLKKITHVERPDGSSFNSFPSGHTATAFMGAELLYQEYKDVSPWYGISGYVVAAGTGAFRMYNNRHWLTDVVAGAGIGILSTKAAYWLYPSVNKLLSSKKHQNRKSAFLPYYDGKQFGFGLVSSF